MKHYLLVGGANYNHIEFSRYVKISMICLKSTKNIKKEIYENIFFVDNFEDVEQLKIYNLKKFNFDYIYTFSELNQSFTSEISEYYHIKGMKLSKIEFLNDKYLVREELRKFGLSKINSEVVTTEKQIIDFAKKYAFPIIIKPKIGIGGRNINKIDCVNQLESISFDEELIVEEFIKGKEFSVESYTFDGVTRVFTVTEKLKDEKMNEIGHIVPANISDLQKNKIEIYISKINKILGIINSVNHSEIFILENGDIELVETHFRMGGDMLGKLMTDSFGENVIDTWGKSISNGEIYKGKISWTGYYNSIHYKYSRREGILKKIVIPEKLKKLPIVKIKEKEDRLLTSGNANRVLYLMYRSKEYKEAKGIGNLLKLIEIEVEHE